MKTGSNNTEICLGEDGKQVYPCRCGEVHAGNYAEYDFGHHNCFHETDLIAIGQDQVLCPDCGMSWRVKNKVGIKDG